MKRISSSNFAFVLVGTLLLFVFSALSTPAQMTRGVISGTVRDENGAALPGVQVTITSNGSNLTKREAITDGEGFYRVILRHGFMQEVDVPAVLATIEDCAGVFKSMETSYFLARQTLVASHRPGMAIWREKLFAWMLRNAGSTDVARGNLPHAASPCTASSGGHFHTAKVSTASMQVVMNIVPVTAIP